MKHQRYSFEEFEVLFRDCFASQEALQREYDSFLSTFEQLDQAAVPELSHGQKADIFKQSWQGRPREAPWTLTLRDVFRRPALTFALGMVLGCILMSLALDDPIDLSGTASSDELFKVEHTRHSRTYTGKIINDFYSQFENPEIVLEDSEEAGPPRATLHGTLDNGAICVVWNL